VKSSQKHPGCKKCGTAFKSLDEKSCEIKGGGHEMAAIMLILIKVLIMTLCALIKFININIIAAISWLPTLISQLFLPKLFKGCTTFLTARLFLRGSILSSTLIKQSYNSKLSNLFEHLDLFKLMLDSNGLYKYDVFSCIQV